MSDQVELLRHQVQDAADAVFLLSRARSLRELARKQSSDRQADVLIEVAEALEFDALSMVGEGATNHADL